LNDIMSRAKKQFGDRLEWRDGAIFLDGWRVCRDRLTTGSAARFLAAIDQAIEREAGAQN
jgi:hypothetical protein